jgi:hypothetical protein
MLQSYNFSTAIRFFLSVNLIRMDTFKSRQQEIIIMPNRIFLC